MLPLMLTRSLVRSLIASDSLACDLMGAASFRAKLIDYKFSIQRKLFCLPLATPIFMTPYNGASV